MAEVSRRHFFRMLRGRPQTPPQAPLVPERITFTIAESACLAYQNSFCSVCREQCPEPGAIQVTQGRPTIDAALCTGCGVCSFVCPAPGQAVVYTPVPS